MLLGSVALSAVVVTLAGCGSKPPTPSGRPAEPPFTAPVTRTGAEPPVRGVAGGGDLAVTMFGRVAAVSPTGEIRWAVGVDDSVRYGPEPTEVAPVAISGMGPRPQWSPDRRWIAFSAGINEDQYGVYLVSSRGGSPRVVVAPSAEGGASGPLDFRWSPNSNWLAYTAQGAGVVVVDREGDGKALRLRQFDVWNELWADWLDGRRLAVIGVDRRSRLVLVEVDVARGTTRLVATLSAHSIDFGAELSGNRKVIAWWTTPATKSAAGRLSTIRTDGNGSRLVGRFRDLTVAAPDYAGSRLAILYNRGLYLARGTGPPVLIDPAAQTGRTALAWNPTYTKLAYLRGDGIWALDLESTTNSRTLSGSDYAFDW